MTHDSRFNEQNTYLSRILRVYLFNLILWILSKYQQQLWIENKENLEFSTILSKFCHFENKKEKIKNFHFQASKWDNGRLERVQCPENKFPRKSMQMHRCFDFGP